MVVVSSKIQAGAATLLAALRRDSITQPESENVEASDAGAFSRYMGGKQRSCEAIIAELTRAAQSPGPWKAYCSPFLGMGSDFWEAVRRGVITQDTQVWLGDVSRDTIDAWWAVRTHGADILTLVEPYRRAYDAAPSVELFNAWRAQYNAGDRSVGLSFALRWTISNGIWRRSLRTGLNSSWGKDLRMRLKPASRLAACQRVLAWPNIRIWCSNWLGTLAAADQPGLVAYFDPPYLDGETKYTSSGFGLDETTQLVDYLARMPHATVALSNHDRAVLRKLVRERWPTAYTRILRVGRTVSFTGDARDPVNEVLLVAPQAQRGSIQ